MLQRSKGRSKCPHLAFWAGLREFQWRKQILFCFLTLPLPNALDESVWWFSFVEKRMQHQSLCLLLNRIVVLRQWGANPTS